jgi:hypothetical protein
MLCSYKKLVCWSPSKFTFYIHIWTFFQTTLKTSAKESLGHYELQQQKPWFDDECSILIDRRKQAKLQWLQNPSHVIGDNMDNVRREASRTFRTKKGNI